MIDAIRNAMVAPVDGYINAFTTSPIGIGLMTVGVVLGIYALLKVRSEFKGSSLTATA